MKKNPRDFDLISFSIGKKVQQIKHILDNFHHVKYICLQEKEARNMIDNVEYMTK